MEWRRVGRTPEQRSPSRAPSGRVLQTDSAIIGGDFWEPGARTLVQA